MNLTILPNFLSKFTVNANIINNTDKLTDIKYKNYAITIQPSSNPDYSTVTLTLTFEINKTVKNIPLPDNPLDMLKFYKS